jgi:hypothetical protein
MQPACHAQLAGDGRGGDIVGLSATAAIDRDALPADRDEPYLTEYAAHIARIGITHESFAQRFSVPVPIRIARVDGR